MSNSLGEEHKDDDMCIDSLEPAAENEGGHALGEKEKQDHDRPLGPGPSGKEKLHGKTCRLQTQRERANPYPTHTHVSTSSTHSHEQNETWAKYLCLGLLVTVVKNNFLYLRYTVLEDRERKVASIDKFLMHFLGLSMELLSPPILDSMRILNPQLTKALNNLTKLNDQLFENFNAVIERIISEVKGRGCYSFFQVGAHLVNHLMITSPEDKKLIGGLWNTLQLPNAPEYNCEKLFFVMKRWCQTFGVVLEDIDKYVNVPAPNLF